MTLGSGIAIAAIWLCVGPRASAALSISEDDMNLARGKIVCVTPNTLSLYQSDHLEPVWVGRVIYTTASSVGVEPVDGNLPRDVLRFRVRGCAMS